MRLGDGVWGVRVITFRQGDCVRLKGLVDVAKWHGLSLVRLRVRVRVRVSVRVRGLGGLGYLCRSWKHVETKLQDTNRHLHLRVTTLRLEGLGLEGARGRAERG